MEGDSKDLELYHLIWKPENGKIQCGMLFVHGFLDHVTRLRDVFTKLSNSAGALILGYDGRGFGRSARVWYQCGATFGWLRQLSDIDDATLLLYGLVGGNKPLFLCGHSMGGGLVLKYGLDGTYRDKYDGYLSIAPLILLHPLTEPNSWIRKLGILFKDVLPRLPIYTEIKNDYLTRDKQNRLKIKADSFVGKFGTLKGIADMLLGGESLLIDAKKFDKTLYIAHGTADMVTLFSASKKFFELSPSKDKTFKPYEGAYHGLFDEVPEVQEQVLLDMSQWMKEHSIKAVTQ